MINFPTNNLREVEIEPFDGEGGETMDFKTYCDTIIRNYLIDTNIPVEDVVMPDAYYQYDIDSEEDTMDGDYLKPYIPIIAIYNNTLIIDESKQYIAGDNSILAHPSIMPGNNAEKEPSSSFENYCIIIGDPYS